MVIFLDITSFKTFQKVVGGDDTEIVDTTWKNLIRKWTYPLDSGNIRFDAGAELGPNEDQGEWVTDFGRASNRERGISRTVLPKPVMLTGTADGILAYTLDFLIDPETSVAGNTAAINPDVVNDGLDKLKKLTSEDGLTWTVAVDDGVVLDLSEAELKPNNIKILTQGNLDVTKQDVFPVPFLLFNRSNIA
ncbi:hypothetical protein LCGC14_2091770 [marine sediment metagenome]|uniref:Uncharacterized protein n=1 Tax=marine sediment metagenome TaxID=412755 RepID=A0A0F9H9F4_9ZZZZ